MHSGNQVFARLPPSVPLEFQSWLSLHAQTLAFHAHDPAATKGGFGDSDSIGELAEALTYARVYLGGVTPDTRAAFRAGAFAKFQNQLREVVTDLAKRVEENGSTILLKSSLLETISLCREALSWFSTEEDLKKAAAIRAAREGGKTPDLHLHVMRSLLDEGEGLVTKLAETKTSGSAFKAQVTPPDAAARYCHRCGGGLLAAALYCSKCGTKIPV